MSPPPTIEQLAALAAILSVSILSGVLIYHLYRVLEARAYGLITALGALSVVPLLSFIIPWFVSSIRFNDFAEVTLCLLLVLICCLASKLESARMGGHFMTSFVFFCACILPILILVPLTLPSFYYTPAVRAAIPKSIYRDLPTLIQMSFAIGVFSAPLYVRAVLNARRDVREALGVPVVETES